MLTGSLVAGLMMDMFQLRQAFSFGPDYSFFIHITERKNCSMIHKLLWPKHSMLKCHEVLEFPLYSTLSDRIK